MARTLTEAPITTPSARKKLPAGLHWRGIDPDVHLGYRKGKRGGVWLVRWRISKGYKQASLGTADDVVKEGTLDYSAAAKAAREKVKEARKEAAAEAAGPVLTIRSAVESYCTARDARETRRAGRPKRSDASQRLARYVLGQAARGKSEKIPPAPLASVPLHRLKEKDLLAWRDGLPDGLKATTRQRLINDLKAALNSGYAANREKLDPTLPAIIKHGLKADQADDDEAVPVARDNQVLSDGDIGRLLQAAREVDAEQEWDGDLFRLVLVLAATGARFSQVARMRVGDAQIAESRLMVPVSRKGRGAKNGTLTVPVGRDVIDALVPVMSDKPADATLLERWRHEQVKGSIAWQRGYRGPWQSSAELVRPWQNIRERAGLPQAVPYALRHSSIVKQIRANLPIRLVAALHDTSTAMIERHYAKYVTTGLEDMARAAITPLVPSESGADVVQIGRRR